MTTIQWNPDTCICKILLDENMDFVDWIVKCNLHKNSTNFITDVKTHNKSFTPPGDSKAWTEEVLAKANADKSTEQKRIRTEGKEIKNE